MCGVYQELFDWDPLRMPSVSALTDAASNWIKVRESARDELRLGDQARRRADRDAVVADLECVEQQLKASQRQVNREPVFLCILYYVYCILHILYRLFSHGS